MIRVGMRMTEDELERARKAYACRDWAAARDAYRAAGPLAPDDLAALATACWWLGLTDENIRLSADLHQLLLHDRDVAGAAKVALEIGFTEALRGREDVGMPWIARARRLFDQVPDAPERGLLMIVEADLAADTGDLDTAEDLAHRVLELGERHDDATLLALGLFVSGVLALRRGRTREGLDRLDEAMLPVQAGDVQPEWAGNLYCRMMQLCHELADLSRGRRWNSLAEHWCRGYAPAVLFTGICRVHRVQVMQAQGKWAEAESEALRAAEDLVELDLVPAAEAYYRLGEVHRLRGNLELAESAYRRAHELGRDPLPGLALLHLCRGRGHVATSVLEAALEVEHAPLGRAPLLAAHAEVALAIDRVDTAARCVEELSRIADQYASQGWRSAARRWQGAVRLHEGRCADAMPVLREARGWYQRMNAPYEVARIRMDLAAAAEGLGDDDTAHRERSEAEATFERLRADRDLSRLRAQRRHRSNPGGLSARELEVLAVVAGGVTNREAAAHLGISERTVGRHLANVYLKTGVSSRTAAVAWARDHGLL